MTAQAVRDEIARAVLYGTTALVTFLVLLRELERRTG